MNFFLQFVVVLLFVSFFHFINQMLLLKKNDFKLQWKSVLILISMSGVITLLLNIPSRVQDFEFPL